MKNVYLLLAALGLLLAGYFIVLMTVQPGPGLLASLAPFASNTLITLLGVDLALSATVFWVFVFHESARLKLPHPWVFVVATLAVGLCFALPLFLYFRQRRLDQSPGA